MEGTRDEVAMDCDCAGVRSVWHVATTQDAVHAAPGHSVRQAARMAVSPATMGDSGHDCEDSVKRLLISLVFAWFIAQTVRGIAIDITGVHGQGPRYAVDATRHGRTNVMDLSNCGAPKLGSAYAQFVTVGSVEYRTLHSGGCAYEIVP